MQCQAPTIKCSKNVVVYRSYQCKTNANDSSLLCCNCLRNIVKSKIFRTGQKSRQVYEAGEQTKFFVRVIASLRRHPCPADSVLRDPENLRLCVVRAIQHQSRRAWIKRRSKIARRLTRLPVAAHAIVQIKPATCDELRFGCGRERRQRRSLPLHRSVYTGRKPMVKPGGNRRVRSNISQPKPHDDSGG